MDARRRDSRFYGCLDFFRELKIQMSLAWRVTDSRRMEKGSAFLGNFTLMDTTHPMHCPYCNATLDLSAEEMSLPRIQCSSCGDSFSNRLAVAPSQAIATGHLSNAQSNNGFELRQPQPVKWSNVGVARSVLTIMGFMAAIALVFAIITQPFRRENDKKKAIQPPPEVPTLSAEQTPPARLAGLGLFPENSDMVAGIHIRDFLRSSEGKKTFENLKENLLKEPLEKIKQTTGLRVQDLDHVVLATRFNKKGQEMFVVVRTVKSYSPEKIGQALNHSKPDSFRNRPVYRSKGNPLVNGLFWCKDARTLVISLRLGAVRLEDLETFPKKAKSGTTALSSPLRRALEKRMDPSNVLWVVGETEPLKEILKYLPKSPQGENRKQVEKTLQKVEEAQQKVKIFSMGVRLQKGITFSGNFQAKDWQAAQFLSQYFKDNLFGAKVFGLAEEADPDNPEDWWIAVQYRFPNPWAKDAEKKKK